MAQQNSINNKTSELTIDPGVSADSFVQFDINTTSEFRVGVDDTNGSFKISQGSALGTNDTFIMTDAGERTMPLQSAFLATVTTTVTNVTGDSTSYTLVFDAEVFDQNNDFDGTSTFTAPITGRYRFEASALLGDLNSSHTNGFFILNTSNRNFLWQLDPGTGRDKTTNEYPCYMFCLADMDTSDTVVFSIDISGSTKTVDVTSNGATDPRSWFSGNLEV